MGGVWGLESLYTFLSLGRSPWWSCRQPTTSAHERAASDPTGQVEITEHILKTFPEKKNTLSTVLWTHLTNITFMSPIIQFLHSKSREIKSGLVLSSDVKFCQNQPDCCWQRLRECEVVCVSSFFLTAQDRSSYTFAIWLQLLYHFSSKIMGCSKCEF